MKTRHGDLYDCVNFYKQPAFSHPLSKKLTLIPQDRGIHCFNTLCPGFVVTEKRRPVDSVLDQVSIPGREGYEVDLSISLDSFQHWSLRVANSEIGYWPVYLFQSPGLAQYVEWGGEVFASEGSLRPGMGSGQIFTEDTKNDAYYSVIKVQTGQSDSFVDPVNLKCKASSNTYEAQKEGNVGKGLEYLIIYGGPPSKI